MDNINSTKRIIYAIVGSIILIGVLYYFFFWNSSAPVPSSPSSTSQTSGKVSVPSTGNQGIGETNPNSNPALNTIENPTGKLVQITNFSVLAPSLNKDENKIIYYKKDGGDMYSSDLDGKNQQKISNITILNLFDAIWSPLRDRSAVFYLEQENIKSFLHIGTTSVAIMPMGIAGFDWSPDGKSLAYLLKTNTGSSLNIADSSGKNSKLVFSTPIKDAQIKWFTGDKIIFTTAPSGLADGFIYSYSRSTGTFKKIFGPLPGLTSRWSPDGSLVAIGSVNPDTGEASVNIKDASGKDIYSIGLKTLPEKCFWPDNKFIFCAVPLDAPRGNWLDNYLSGEVNTRDQIVMLDPIGKAIYAVYADAQFDISRIAMTKDKNNLFFINRLEGTLWGLNLR